MIRKDLCPWCEGGGLAVNGEDACDGCGGSGAWRDAIAVSAVMARDFAALLEGLTKADAVRHELNFVLGFGRRPA